MGRVYRSTSGYTVYRRQEVELGCDRYDGARHARGKICQQAAEMIGMRRVIFLIIYVSCFARPLQAQSDFYKGKQIKIVVGASAGAASDLYARVVAHHLPKHVSGKPDIIVQNMPGGGSITAANYVSSVAKPDGLTLGAVTAPIYFAQLLGRKEVQFDWSKFTLIGKPEEKDELFFLLSDQPYRAIFDLSNVREPQH